MTREAFVSQLAVSIARTAPFSALQPRPPTCVCQPPSRPELDSAFQRSGSGKATLYLVGPGHGDRSARCSSVRTSNSAPTICKMPATTRLVIGEDSATFFVTAGPVSSIAFLARPSRVPANTPNVISGTAFLFDKYQNLVLQPQPVKFELTVNGQTVEPHRNLEGWGGLRQAGFLQERRSGAVRRLQRQRFCSARGAAGRVRSLQHPHDARSLTRTASWYGLIPIHDCAGNPVPDGTIVTFTSIDSQGKSTVDARIKQGIAQAQLPASNDATISVASGVVVGNEIQWRGGQ